MKSEMQKEINAKVIEMLESFNHGHHDIAPAKQLRSFSAIVHTCVLEETGEVVYVLQSYNTIIALISGNVMYDFLRYVYGYTATSAQHIVKFRSDYMLDYPFECRKEYRYYEV